MVKGGKAGPDSHAEKGGGGNRLDHQRLSAACVAGDNHSSEPVKNTEQREDYDKRDKVEMDFESRRVLAYEHVDLGPGPGFI